MNKRWSRKHDACTACGTTERKHESRGLCKLCYHRNYAANNEDHLTAYKHQWYLEHGGPVLAKVQREQKHFDGKRQEVLDRDGHRCQSCGTEYQLCVHHMDGNGRNKPIKNNEPSNLATLCKACHMAVHRAELQRARGFVAMTGWSKKYGLDACRVCNRSDRCHRGGGLCWYCYEKKRNSNK